MEKKTGDDDTTAIDDKGTTKEKEKTDDATASSSGVVSTTNSQGKKTTAVTDRPNKGEGEINPSHNISSTPTIPSSEGEGIITQHSLKKDFVNKDDIATFATTESSSSNNNKNHEPSSFTDAGLIYPDKCPRGGCWKGYFENVSVSGVVQCVCCVNAFFFLPAYKQSSIRLFFRATGKKKKILGWSLSSTFKKMPFPVLFPVIIFFNPFLPLFSFF